MLYTLYMKKILLIIIVFFIAIVSFKVITNNSQEKPQDIIQPNIKYMIENKTLNYRVPEVASEDFEFKTRNNSETNESAIDILPIKPRPVDFAWASVNIHLSEKPINMDELIINPEYSKVSVSGIPALTKKLNEDGFIREYVLNKSDRGVTIKIYLNNPNTQDEFEPAINKILNNLEFY